MVTGGIAAYKACFLTRLLVQAGFSVKVAMTEAATHFVTPMTLRVLSGHPVATDLWGEGQSDALDHIEYARWADLVVMAPATANSMAKAAHGIADEIVSTLLLAFPGPVLMAPAMNDNMWRHPATRANLETLESRGVTMVGPGEGWLACGTVDEGRMSEPEEILATVRELAAKIPGGAEPGGPGAWAGRRVVITAGPTHEPVDAVRYLANRSSGALGYALAAAAAEAGARVTLISGPVALTPPRGLAGLVNVTTARQMQTAVDAAVEAADWLIMAAAVADYAPVPAAGKLKKDDLGETWSLALGRNPDILASAAPKYRAAGARIVGFALETADVVATAQKKLAAKGCDLVLANNPLAAGSGFGTGTHQVTLVGPQGVLWRSPSLPKSDLARAILDRLDEAAR
jgi:phosphopantothenoylcysteine decarboxylase/phosphopantothenate--cysteine ligase